MPSTTCTTLLEVYRWIFCIIWEHKDVALFLKCYKRCLHDVLIENTIEWVPSELLGSPVPLFTNNLGVLGEYAIRDILLVCFFIKRVIEQPDENIANKLRMFGTGNFIITGDTTYLKECLRLRVMVGARVVCHNFLGKGIWFDKLF